MARENEVYVDLTFRSRLKKFDRSLAKLDKKIKRVEARPILIPVKLDTSGLMAQAKAATREVQAAMAKVRPGESISGGGVIDPTGGSSRERERRRNSQRISQQEQRIFEPDGESGTLSQTGRVRQDVKLLDDGLRETVTTTESLKDGMFEVNRVVEKTTDTTPIRNFEKSLKRVTAASDNLIREGTAGADQNKILQGLEQRRRALNDFLNSPDAEAFRQEKAFANAQRDLEQTSRKIDTLRGRNTVKERTEENKRAIKEFENSVRGITRASNPEIKSAQGANDIDRQVAGLTKQREEVRSLLRATNNEEVISSSAYKRAETRIDAINERLANLSGRKGQKERVDGFNRQIAAADKQLKADLEGLDIQRKKNKLIEDEGKRRQAQAVNQFQRNTTLDRADANLRAIQRRASEDGLGDVADKAGRRRESINTTRAQRERELLEEQKNRQTGERQRQLKQELDTIDAQTKARQKQFAQQEKINNASGTAEQKARRQAKLLEEQARFYQQSADATRDIAKRSKDFGFNDLERTATRKTRDFTNRSQAAVDERAVKEAEGNARQTEQNLRERLRLLKNITKEKLTQNAADRRVATNKAGDPAERNKILQDSLENERRILQSAQKDASKIEADSKKRGFSGISKEASNLHSTYGRDIIKTNGQIIASNQLTGKSFNFHSSSLLRNAASFARWNLAAAAVIAPLAAIAAGLRNAIRADRQFATLRAVFQGTGDEARQLKKDTLLLAAANGRSAEEALDAAIAWGRLGLSRAQTAELIQTSLRAANVGEIEAAEATTKLIAIYKAFNLEVGQIPQTLDRLNALTNRYAVTLSDLFEGISRTGALAQQSGLNLPDLEGIITAVTSATGRPGQEIGNSIKFLTTRIRRPETLEKLKEAFDIDLTDSNGQIMEMSEIFTRLAQIYPTLNRSQKAYFESTAAGSRQANRLALILDTWTESQIAATRALLDTNSAAEENEKIVNSLSSQLQQLSTSWTALVGSIGDSGLFSFLSEQFAVLGDELRDFGNLYEQVQENLNSGGESFKISNPLTKNFVDDLLEFEDFKKADIKGRLTSFQPETRTIRDLERIVALTEQLIRYGEIARNGNPLRSEEGRQISQNIDDQLGPVQGSEVRRELANPGIFSDREDELARYKVRLEEINELLREQRKLSGEAQQDMQSAEISAITTIINDGRSRVDGFRKAISTLSLLEFDLQIDDANFDRIQKQFGDLREAISQLPEGGQVAANVLPDFSKAVKEQDVEGARQILRDLSDLFAGELPGGINALGEEGSTAIAELEKRAATAREQLEKAFAGAANGADNDEEITRASDRLEEIEDAIREVTKLSQNLSKTPIKINVSDSVGITRLNRRVEQISETLAKATTSLTVQGADNADRQYERQLAAERIKLNLLREQLRVSQEAEKVRATERTAEIAALGPEDQGRIEALRYEKAFVKDILQDRQTQVTAAEAELKKRQQILADEREATRLRNTFDRAAQDEEIRSIQFDVGRNPGERLINQTNALLAESRTAAMAPPGDNALSIAEQTARALTREAQIRQNVTDLARREMELRRDITQQAIETTEEERKQLEAAERKFQLANREDQLRAAALKSAINQGDISETEFTFLSGATRRTLSDFYPNQVPGGGEREQETQRMRGELDRITRTLGPLQNRLADLTARNNQQATLPEQPGQFGINTQPVQNTRHDGAARNPQIDLGGFNVRVAIEEQVMPLISEITDNISARVERQIANLLEMSNRESDTERIGRIQAGANS